MRPGVWAYLLVLPTAVASAFLALLALGPVRVYAVRWQEGCPGCNGMVTVLPAFMLGLAVAVLGVPAKCWIDLEVGAR